MSEFKNVTVVKKATVYFDGKVTSRAVLFEDGTKKTRGVMLAGDYEFNTAAAKIMEILGGEMEVLIAGEPEWKTFREGDSFEVRVTRRARALFQAASRAGQTATTNHINGYTFSENALTPVQQQQSSPHHAPGDSACNLIRVHTHV